MNNEKLNQLYDKCSDSIDKINKSIMDYEEITAKEYYNAMEEYFKQIIEFTNKKIVYNFDKKNYEIK